VKKAGVEQQKKCLIAVRLRGQSASRREIKETFTSLRLLKRYHASIYYDTPPINGMLKRTKDYLTWGEAKPDIVRQILEKRAEIRRGKGSTRDLAKALGYPSIHDLAEAVTKGTVPLTTLWKTGIKPVFRLHPPTGGFKGTIRVSYKGGGELGYRGDAINDLLSRMV